MSKVTSKDGTQIAYERQGAGKSVILVDGALGYRSFSSMTQLAELLAPHFTVYTYDRRGRGESGNSRPYALEREKESCPNRYQKMGLQASGTRHQKRASLACAFMGEVYRGHHAVATAILIALTRTS